MAAGCARGRRRRRVRSRPVPGAVPRAGPPRRPEGVELVVEEQDLGRVLVASTPRSVQPAVFGTCRKMMHRCGSRPPPGVRPVGLDLLCINPINAWRRAVLAGRAGGGGDGGRTAASGPGCEARAGPWDRSRSGCGSAPETRRPRAGTRGPAARSPPPANRLRVPVELDVELVTLGDQRRRPLVRGGAPRPPGGVPRRVHRQPPAERAADEDEALVEALGQPHDEEAIQVRLRLVEGSDPERRRLDRVRPRAARARPRPGRREAASGGCPAGPSTASTKSSRPMPLRTASSWNQCWG